MDGTYELQIWQVRLREYEFDIFQLVIFQLHVSDVLSRLAIQNGVSSDIDSELSMKIVAICLQLRPIQSSDITSRKTQVEGR